MTVRRIIFNDNIKAEVNKSIAFWNGATGEIMLTVIGESGTTTSLMIYAGPSATRAIARDKLADLHRAIGELLAELNRGERS